jgi:hypothetical protein
VRAPGTSFERVTQLVTSFSSLAPVMTKIPAHRRKGGSVEVVDSKYAVDLATQQSYSENIFLFVPNLIGQYFLFFFSHMLSGAIGIQAILA